MAAFELPTRPADPRHSIDVCVRDAARILFIEEASQTFTDLGAANGSTGTKEAEAADLAAVIGHEASFRVATVWVSVRDGEKKPGPDREIPAGCSGLLVGDP